MSQINARLSREIRKRFEQYAAEVGLDASELARLLIVRAMRRRKKPRPLTGVAKKSVQWKLTAHFHRQEDVDEFDRYAITLGLRRAAAAKLIFESELDERWLARALLWAPRKPKLLP